MAAAVDDLPHILVVDDDRRIRQLLQSYLLENEFRVTVAASAAEAREKMRGVVFDAETKMKGIRLDIADYRRPDPKCAPVHAKAAGLYMICTISKHKAEKKGCADAMMLDWQGRVAECTGANIFFTRDGAIHTPIADCFLNGLTRQTVIALAKEQGMEIIERRILPDELPSFNECFIVGSAAEVTPVAEIGLHKFKPGNISRAMMDAYSNAVRPKAKAV